MSGHSTAAERYHAALIFIWDWLIAAAGWHNTLLLGMSHLLIDLTWTMALAVIGFRKLLGLPAWLSVALVLAWLAAAVPLAALLLRPYVM